MWQQMLDQLFSGDIRNLARTISYVENEQDGFDKILSALPAGSSSKIIGITGPPGAGKSTLVDRLIGEMVSRHKKVAVLCVDPSSPFHLGALLGDRVRMSQWYLDPSVFIRSLASRGALGGLHPKIIELTALTQAAGYDYTIVETVGVGQSEVEIAGLADVTVVVLVPEAGDEVQTMKAGLMEIADIFVVNKSDRPDAALMVRSLIELTAHGIVPVIKTVASEGRGIDELYEAINNLLQHEKVSERRYRLLTERVYYLIQKHRMRDISKDEIFNKISRHTNAGALNIYKFAASYEREL